MKAILTQRVYSVGVYSVGVDTIQLHSYDKDDNRFDITYTGKQNMPVNLDRYDIDIEIKVSLTPKANQKITKEFK